MWADGRDHHGHHRNGGSFEVAPCSRGDLLQAVNTTEFLSAQGPNQHSTIDAVSSNDEMVAIVNSPSSSSPNSSEESSDCDGETVQTADLSCSPSINATHSHDEDSTTTDAAIETTQSLLNLSSRSLKQHLKTTETTSTLPFQMQKLPDNNNRMSSNLPRINEKTPTTPFLPPLSPSSKVNNSRNNHYHRTSLKWNHQNSHYNNFAENALGANHLLHPSSSHTPSSSIHNNNKGNAIPIPSHADSHRSPLHLSNDNKQGLTLGTATATASSRTPAAAIKSWQTNPNPSHTQLMNNNLPVNRRTSKLSIQPSHPSSFFRHERNILTQNIQDIEPYNGTLKLPSSSSSHTNNQSTTTHHHLYGQNLKRSISHSQQNQSSLYNNLQSTPSPQQQVIQYEPRPTHLLGSYLIASPAASPHIRSTIGPSQNGLPPQRPPSPASPGNSIPPAPSPNRSAPEILKTLLRKKACLYEPVTSRVIALITWHVGRNLAFNNGYFSRQHLQSGVHAVVSEKIKAGFITRTKVNRCMQIILNSCFHYIIPRPDGSEEKGDTFRNTFAKSAIDDSFLLTSLPPPWHDLKYKFEQFLHNFNLGSSSQDDDHDNVQQDKVKKGGKDNLKQGHPSKRPVLLCFNENVRSAEDVMLSHNEFIRDAANAADLHLTAEDWILFFSGEDDDSSHVTEGTADTTLSGGIVPINSPVPETMLSTTVDPPQIPEISFDSGYLPDFLLCRDVTTEPSTFKKIDYWGQMNSSELTKFRTTYCCKRYDHDFFRCKFAHIDVNGGWLRRDPMIFQYIDKLCPHIKHLNAGNSISYQLNTCPKGISCKFAHSSEEIEYHPNRYKKDLCASCSTCPSPCDLKDLCPLSHPASHQKSNQNGGGLHTQPLRKSRDSSNSNRSNIPLGRSPMPSFTIHGVETSFPNGAPMMYINPAPMSDFDNYLMLPGLRDLYRRNCLVHLSQVDGTPKSKPLYSNFGVLFSTT